MIQALSRRDRVRAETTEEIKQTARRILVEQGPAAVTLRAIAREMGVTAPALYRYFDSHEELIRRVVGDIFGELATETQEAIARGRTASDGDMAQKMIGARHGFRPAGRSTTREFAPAVRHAVPGVNIETMTSPRNAPASSPAPSTPCSRSCGRRPVPGAATREDRPRPAEQLDRYRDGMWHRAAPRRAARFPALLGAALRHRQHGGVRAPGLRAGRPGARYSRSRSPNRPTLVGLEYPPR